MAQTITVIPGDGIGPEVTDATLTVLKAAGAALEYAMQQAGLIALQEQRNPLPKSTLESAEANRIMLKGPLTTPSGAGFRSINVEMRKAFDLYPGGATRTSISCSFARTRKACTWAWSTTSESTVTRMRPPNRS